MLENINIDRDIKIIFMGTPDFSVPVLEALIGKYTVRAIITKPDREVGRDRKVVAPPVKQVGDKHTILVLQPERIKDYVSEVLSLEPDLIVTCAYGQIIPKAILDAPKYGCINVHASLLPKLRGGAPIQYAIMEGHKKTGITIMHMNPRMDEGDIISQAEIEIDEKDTSSSLHEKLKFLGRDLLMETLPKIIDGSAPRAKQNSSEATYAFIIKHEDEKLDFNRTKRELYNHIRALNNWPGAYCNLSGHILKVWAAEMTDNYFPELINGQVTKLYDNGIGVKVGNGELILTEVQLEGRKRMPASEFINGIANKEELLNKILA
jgi:methionyl-tRNA formyltransferase